MAALGKKPEMKNKKAVRAVIRDLAGRLFAAVLLGMAVAGPAQAIEVIDSNGGTLYVEVNKGRLLRLDEVPATVFLADPSIAEIEFKSPRLVYLFGRRTGETSLFALDKKDQVLINRKIIVGYDLDQITAAINQLIPNAAVRVSMINTTLVLDGTVASPGEASAVMGLAQTYAGGGAVLNRLKVSMPNQINLKVTFAEISRNVVKELGFDFSATGSGFETFTSLTAGAASGTIGAIITGDVGRTSFESVFSALETEGLATILAEPNLTALSGNTASFFAGGEIPFGTTDVDGNVSVSFRSFGVSLSFTPTLVDSSRIRMVVAPEVSQLSGFSAVLGGNTVRGLSTRRASTTVELGNGESLVLGGLLQRNTREDIAKVPGLGDIPILGALFRSAEYQRDETELLIIVTPYIVRPTSERLATPVDGFQSPTDYEMYAWGAMYRDSTGSMPERVGTLRGQKLVGRVGFHIE